MKKKIVISLSIQETYISQTRDYLNWIEKQKWLIGKQTYIYIQCSQYYLENAI